MDPKACLEAFLSARTKEEYNGYQSDLIGWLNSGGFGPKVRNMRTDAVGTLVKLTYTGDAVVRWGNNRKTTLRLRDLEVV